MWNFCKQTPFAFLSTLFVNAPLETYENVKRILDHVNLGIVKFKDIIASDLKLINMIVGIQSHSASCPCAFCEWEKKDGLDGEAAERTTENIE